MTRELARAVQVESVEAIVYHWGVSRYKVRRWRHALGVDRFNDGTLDLWQAWHRSSTRPTPSSTSARQWPYSER